MEYEYQVAIMSDHLINSKKECKLGVGPDTHDDVGDFVIAGQVILP